jgi:RNA polymerase sigma factor (sigma-70 family)
MFLTMQEYLTIASKMLALYGYNCHKNDEDAIAYVATSMMNADNTWDGIRTSRKTWRFIQAKYAIMKLRTKTRQQRKMVSLNSEIRTNGNKTVSLHELIPGKTSPVVNEQFQQVIVKAKELLTPKQYSCLTMYYIEDLTLDVIGKSLSISKQRVSQHIQKAIQVLQNEYKAGTYTLTS